MEILVNLFEKVLKAEKISYDLQALQIVARAADGSARDGLSMLDQAIVLGNGNIDAETVKNMLGLADRRQSFAVYEKLLEGDIAEVLRLVHELYTNGATPMLILQDMVDITHLLAKVKILPEFINDASLSETDKEMCKKLCSAPISILSKIWQMLIKGLSEIQYASVQIDALEMILMRIAYSASLPTPADLLKELKKKSTITDTGSSDILQSNVADNSVVLDTTADLVKFMTAKKQPLLLFAIKNDMSFKEFKDGYLHIALSDKADKNLILNFRTFLEKATGKVWKFDIDYEPLGETLAFQEAKEFDRDKKNISEYPLVKAILDEFNGAKIETFIRKSIEEAENEETDGFDTGAMLNENEEEE